MVKPKSTAPSPKSSRSAAKAASVKREGAGAEAAKSDKPAKTPTQRKPPVAAAPAVDAGGKKSAKKLKKDKVIRDSFTMPAVDYEKIAALKKKCLAMGIAVKKSELLRAGLLLLERASNEDLAQVVEAVESIKTGRPAGKKKKNKADRK